MKLIKPYYEIISPIDGEEILKQIELAARTCYKSEGKIEYDKWKYQINNGETKPFGGEGNFIAKSARILISKLMIRGHEAMLEFGGNITVKFICDRGVSHELVRHRLCSFAQESTRYCNYGNQEHVIFILPCWFKRTPELEAKSALELHKLIPDIAGVDYEYSWCIKRLAQEEEYNELIKDAGWSPQEARSVLPNALKTEINVSANIREWRHIFKLRTSNEAHPQMQELMRPLLKEFQEKIPILFNYIIY